MGLAIERMPNSRSNFEIDTTSGGGTIPTVTDNAFSLGLISNKVLGISFEPSTETSSTNGELTFGGIDSSKFTGDITFVYGLVDRSKGGS